VIEIGVKEVKAKLDAGEPVHLLDVREHQELEICSLPGAEHIPMMSLFTGIRKTTAGPDAEIVVFCHVGVRSFEAANYLRMQGFKNARSMAGGVDAWAREVDPSMARY
jgi:rhodanese-related sulfurtransferase